MLLYTTIVFSMVSLYKTIVAAQLSLKHLGKIKHIAPGGITSLGAVFFERRPSLCT